MMTSRSDKHGGPAFPVPGLNRGDYNNGMTLRDYFAAKAMQALLQLGADSDEFKEDAHMAYKVADAMLKAREQ